MTTILKNQNLNKIIKQFTLFIFLSFSKILRNYNIPLCYHLHDYTKLHSTQSYYHYYSNWKGTEQKSK